MFNVHSKKNISEEWLTWFIGFTEGDGAILITRGKAKFVLTQKEGAILYEVQKVLGFGEVKLYGNYYRYIVSEVDSILLLFYLFNGNLVLSHRLKQLENWVIALNSSEDLNLVLNTRLLKPTLRDAWLSGFTDAEGCFSINIRKRLETVTGYRVSIKYTLDQKDAESTLLHIKDLIGFGQVNLRKETNSVYRYSNDSFKGLLPVSSYFIAYQLKTKKKESFKHWLNVFTMLQNKEHLNIEGLDKIRAISKIINLTADK